jgi:hypothetical protein
MAREYRVVDCRTEVIAPTEITITADTPEHDARLAVGEDLIRGGGMGKRKVLIARVYCGAGPTLTMVRLYAKGPQDKEKHERTTTHRWGD